MHCELLVSTSQTVFTLVGLFSIFAVYSAAVSQESCNIFVGRSTINSAVLHRLNRIQYLVHVVRTYVGTH